MSILIRPLVSLLQIICLYLKTIFIFSRLGASGFGNFGAGNVGLGRNSGYGGSGPSGYSAINVVSGYGPGVCEDRGLNPILVLATLAGAGLAFFIIFRQVTGGGKRTINPTVNEFLEHISNLFWSGKWSRYFPFSLHKLPSFV